MITVDGYSKDPSLMPDGVVITLGKEMMVSNGGYRAMIKLFLATMEHAEGVWMHKMKLRPKVEISDVYIITMNRLWGRVKFGWFASGETFKYSPSDPGIVSWPRMCIVGPFEKCPFKRELRGFQGFRYCTKLF